MDHRNVRKKWVAPEDLPADLRRVIQQGAFVPLLDPKEAEQLRQTVLLTFSEVLDVYLEEHELRWRISHVHRARPELPLDSIFLAVGLELGVSPARLRNIWYVSRRKSRVQHLVKQALGTEQEAAG